MVPVTGEPWSTAIMAGASLLGGAMKPAAPAGPSSADPFNTSIFDSSGWVVNFGSGSRLDTSSSTASKGPDVGSYGAAGGLGASLGLPVGNNDLLLIGGALLMFWLWQK